MALDEPSQCLPLVGVGAVVFRDEAVLLIRRGRPPCAGEWAIPGGKVRPGETLQQAAEREIREETGITIRAGEPVFSFDFIENDAGGRLRWHYVIVDLEAKYLEGEIRAGDDASEAGWFRREELAGMPLHPKTRELLRRRFAFS